MTSEIRGPRAGHGWRHGLAARFTLMTGLLLATLAAAVIAAAAIDAHRVETADVERATLADLTAATARRAAGDAPIAVMAALQADSGVAYAALLDSRGRIIAGAAPSAAIRADVAAGLAALRSDGGMLHAAGPAKLAAGVAEIRIGRSLDGVEEAVAGVITSGVLAALAFLAIALPVVAFLIDRATEPLRALIRAVARAGAAHEELTRASVRRDEIGALARAHLAMTRDLAESAAALERRTVDDPLTRLPNRESMMRRLSAALQVGQPVALLKIEVDGLTRLAIALGADAADAAVTGAAERLREAATEWTRRSSLIAQLGAEHGVFVARTAENEFAFLAHGAAAAAAAELGRLALASFETPLSVRDHRVSLSLTIGVALGPDDGADTDALLRSAAAALGAARAAGAQSVRFANADLNDRAYGRLRIEQELRRAIANGELEVHYQPQIELATGSVSGAEALVRWRHPTRGMVAPGEFVPVAEESGLVEPLGRFVLAEAARMSVAWAAMGIHLRIAVNVSTLQFRNPRFAETVLNIVNAAGADPAQIELEITESTAMSDPAHAARELGPLREAGVRIAIDDFGTGYSNLSTLTRLPFDVLKIDRGFVRDALDAPAAKVVVQTVLGMAASLGVETVAEGVETEEQLRFVTQNGCTVGQGYLFGKPMPAEAFESWCAARLGAEVQALRRLAETGVRPAKTPVRIGGPRFAG